MTNLIIQIGDFGMARDLMDDTYYKSSGGKIPVKWTSPEVRETTTLYTNNHPRLLMPRTPF